MTEISSSKSILCHQGTLLSRLTYTTRRWPKKGPKHVVVLHILQHSTIKFYCVLIVSYIFCF